MKKVPRRPRRRSKAAKVSPPPDCLDALDQIAICCEHIETLAGLLEICGRLEPGNTINPQLTAHAGLMIAEETARLRQWLGKLPRV